jgi:hypothetical protein
MRIAVDSVAPPIGIPSVMPADSTPAIERTRGSAKYAHYPGTWPPHSRLLFTTCLETHYRRAPKTSEHLMTHSNSQSNGAQNTLTKIMLGYVAGVSRLKALRRLSSQ